MSGSFEKLKAKQEAAAKHRVAADRMRRRWIAEGYWAQKHLLNVQRAGDSSVLLEFMRQEYGKGRGSAASYLAINDMREIVR